MKLRKILSSLLATAMLVASVATSAYAATPAINASVRELTADEIAAMEMTGYGVYEVKFDLTGVALSKKNAIQVSKKLNQFTAEFTIASGAENVLAVDIKSAVVTFNAGAEGTNAKWSYVGAGAFPAETADIKETDTTTIVTGYVYTADPTVPVVFEPTANCNVTIADFKGTNYQGDATKAVYTYGNGLAVEGFTCGKAAPAPDPDPTEPTITGDDEGVAATGGKVWNNVVIEDVALGTNYRVQFTDGVDTSDERAIQGLEAAEINGDATFAVVLKTARNIADVVMNILYDIAD